MSNNQPPTSMQDAAKWNPNDKERDASTYAANTASILGSLIQKLSTGCAYVNIEIELKSAHYHFYKLSEIIGLACPQPGAIWVKGIPKERKQHFARVIGPLDENPLDAIIEPIIGCNYWAAYGASFRFSVEDDKIIEYLQDTKEGNKDRDGLEWLYNDHIEFCYRHPDGREEVRYRRIEGTPECNDMISEVNALIEKAKPMVSPYFYRKESEKEVNNGSN